MNVSEKDVARVAELANLELSPVESDRMLQDLNSILDHVAQLNELDTSQINPMAQVGEQLKEWAGIDSTVAPLRVDETVPSLDRNQVLSSAPDTDGIYFKVPKVIER